MLKMHGNSLQSYVGESSRQVSRTSEFISPTAREYLAQKQEAKAAKFKSEVAQEHVLKEQHYNISAETTCESRVKFKHVVQSIIGTGRGRDVRFNFNTVSPFAAEQCKKVDTTLETEIVDYCNVCNLFLT